MHLITSPTHEVVSLMSVSNFAADAFAWKSKVLTFKAYPRKDRQGQLWVRYCHTEFVVNSASILIFYISLCPFHYIVVHARHKHPSMSSVQC